MANFRGVREFYHWPVYDSQARPIGARVDFTLPGPDSFAVQLDPAQGYPKGVQSVFIDASNATNAVALTFNDTTFKIVAPPRSQGWYSAIDTENTIDITVEGAGAFAGVIPVYLFGLRLPPIVWKVT